MIRQSRETFATTPIPTRRQDAANQHQRTDENLGFSTVRPKESQARCLSFPSSRNGAEEDRTPNLGIANAALSQLS